MVFLKKLIKLGTIKERTITKYGKKLPNVKSIVIHLKKKQ